MSRQRTARSKVKSPALGITLVVSLGLLALFFAYGLCFPDRWISEGSFYIGPYSPEFISEITSEMNVIWVARHCSAPVAFLLIALPVFVVCWVWSGLISVVSKNWSTHPSDSLACNRAAYSAQRVMSQLFLGSLAFLYLLSAVFRAPVKPFEFEALEAIAVRFKDFNLIRRMGSITAA